LTEREEEVPLTSDIEDGLIADRLSEKLDSFTYVGVFIDEDVVSVQSK
jgi:hypothetical protein